MKTCPTCKKLCIDQAVQCPKCKNLLTIKADSNRPHQTVPKRFSFGKMLMYILLTCWTIYSLDGIRQNYKTYSLLAWIIVIGVVSIPFIVFYCCLRSNKNKLTKHLPVYTNISDNLYDDTPQIEPQGEIVQVANYEDKETVDQTDKWQDVVYLKRKNDIIRADGKPISDEEIPYLIQLGLVDALNKEAQSTNPKFHRTEYEEELSFQFMYNSKRASKGNSLVNAFEAAYSRAIKMNDVDESIYTLHEALLLFQNAKKYFYSCGKGGTIYFQDMWEYLHNSQRECFSYADIIQERIDFLERIHHYAIPEIKRIISDNEGILQKNIYVLLPIVSKSDIQYILKLLEKDLAISRTKKSNSYELRLL